MNNIKEKRTGNYGHKHSEATKQKLIDYSCEECSIEFKAYIQTNQIHRRYCSLKCAYKNRFGDDNVSRRPDVRKILSKRMIGNSIGLGIPKTKEHRKNIGIGLSKTYSTKSGRETQRKRRMNQVVPNYDTKIELITQKILIDEKIPFIKQAPLIGRTMADFLLVDHNIAIYCDGCFYHGCKKCDVGRLPKWIVERRINDKLITKKLTDNNYRVIRFWEHEIKAVAKYRKQLLKSINQREVL